MLQVLYCCGIRESRPMSDVRHGAAITRQFISSIVTGEDNMSGRMAYERSLNESKTAGETIYKFHERKLHPLRMKTVQLRKRREKVRRSC